MQLLQLSWCHSKRLREVFVFSPTLGILYASRRLTCYDVRTASFWLPGNKEEVCLFGPYTTSPYTLKWKIAKSQKFHSGLANINKKNMYIYIWMMVTYTEIEMNSFHALLLKLPLLLAADRLKWSQKISIINLSCLPSGYNFWEYFHWLLSQFVYTN